MANVQLIDIGPEEQGQRIDNFLLRILKGVPRSHVYRLLRTGQVRVNKGRVKAEYRLAQDDQVRIPPVRTANPPRVPKLSAQQQVCLADCIVYEDDRLLVFDKPTGMAVHGGSGIRSGLIETLRAMRPKAPFFELVHRLDRETSGILLIAKKRSELRFLHSKLREGEVRKHYLALLAGHWSRRTTKIDIALRKNIKRSGERVVLADTGG
ncbi:MAG: pseudouridine synthase, partial [Gammaproteobacteria bacterium]